MMLILIRYVVSAILTGYNAMKTASMANQEYKVRPPTVSINSNEKMV